MDMEYPVMPYAMMALTARQHFSLQLRWCSIRSDVAFTTKWLAARSRSGKPPRPLHGFTGGNAAGFDLIRIGILKHAFKSASMVPQNIVLSTPAGTTISNVVHELDLIIGTGGFVTPYETNSVRLLSGVPHPIIRGYEADLKYETKYHQPPGLARISKVGV